MKTLYSVLYKERGVLTAPMVSLCVNLTSLLGSLKDSGEKHEGSAGWKMSIQVPCLQNFYFSYEKKFLLVLSGLQKV